ncbi:TPA: hypothetical protein RRF16_004308 [Klebsiella pneumoniae]|nr:hypothetical protein [Klebsiella pneumoniae]
MKNIHQTHQAHFFCDNSDATASPAMVMHLLNNLSDYSLLPTYGHELNQFSAEKRPVIVMVDTNENYRVEFASQDLSISSETGNHKDFIGFVNGVYDKLKSTFPEKKSYRLALSSHSFFTDTEESYEELYKKIFTHVNAKPIEWENRIIERVPILNGEEIVNSVSSIRRVEVRVPKIRNGMPTDCVIFEAESNTLPFNTNMRFSLSNCSKYFNELHENNLKLLDLFSRYMK